MRRRRRPRRFTTGPAAISAVAAATGCGIRTFTRRPIRLHVQLTNTQTNAGRGWFGTVSGGCDYQVNSNIVVGALADGDWGSLSGTYSTVSGFQTFTQAGAGVAGGGSFAGLGMQGSETMQSAWYAGGRVGWLVTPTVLGYWEGGYTQAHFSQINLSPVESRPGRRSIHPGANLQRLVPRWRLRLCASDLLWPVLAD